MAFDPNYDLAQQRLTELRRRAATERLARRLRSDDGGRTYRRRPTEVRPARDAS